MNIKQLTAERSNKPYKLTLLTRTDKAAIYNTFLNDKLINFEVVKIRVRDVSRKGGVYQYLTRFGYTHIEVYPSSEEWGKRGWTYGTLKQAIKKFEEIK